MHLWLRACGLALTLASLLAFCGSASAWQERPAKAADAVWIYRDAAPETGVDQRSTSERLFAPFGFMPRERADQISVNNAQPVALDDPSKGTCIEYLFEFRAPDDWMGSYTQPFQHATSCIIMGAGNGLRLSTSPRQGCINDYVRARVLAPTPMPTPTLAAPRVSTDSRHSSLSDASN